MAAAAIAAAVVLPNAASAATVSEANGVVIYQAAPAEVNRSHWAMWSAAMRQPAPAVSGVATAPTTTCAVRAGTTA